ncbi:hypothetical protein GLOIN_2v1844033 [Rhizophagus irregularis DAOM 181602=DAOM 197198]|nr:hypothetical protein GLOIN_2v1844033 [Rhizophagus irregularis DAOM 181602=DAOM 197198]
MDDKVDRFFCDTFHDSRNCNSIRGPGNYGKNTFLSTNYNDNVLGRSVPIVGTLCNEEDEFPGSDEFSKQVDIPCQNAIPLGRPNQYDGIESPKPSINSEFDDFGEKREDNLNHVRSVGTQWGSIAKDKNHQPEYSEGESKRNTGTQSVLSESSKRIQTLSEQLGPLLRVNTPGGSTRYKKKFCQLVLPNDQPKICSNENDASLCQVFPSDEIDGGDGYRNNYPILIDTIMKPNRCYIANSLGYGILDKDQDDYINYIKEELNIYIEEVMEYDFDHIIIIGEQDCGILFLDCFGRVFILDAMSSTLVFHGDYFKGVESVTKGFELKSVEWIIESDTGNIVETDDGSMHDLVPFVKLLMKEEKKKKKSSKKKSSRKKIH